MRSPWMLHSLLFNKMSRSASLFVVGSGEGGVGKGGNGGEGGGGKGGGDGGGGDDGGGGFIGGGGGGGGRFSGGGTHQAVRINCHQHCCACLGG